MKTLNEYMQEVKKNTSVYESSVSVKGSYKDFTVEPKKFLSSSYQAFVWNENKDYWVAWHEASESWEIHYEGGKYKNAIGNVYIGSKESYFLPPYEKGIKISLDVMKLALLVQDVHEELLKIWEENN